MSTFQRRYKEKTFGFGNVKDGRFVRAREREEQRKRQRANSFITNRNISLSSTNIPEPRGAPVTQVSRLDRLAKWKNERDRRKKVEETKKKPPFVVGIVRHKINSPLPTVKPSSTSTQDKVCNHSALKPAASQPKRITKATEKRLMNKGKESVKHVSTHSKFVNKEQKSQTKQNSPLSQKQSFAPKDHKFKAPAGVPYVPLFGRVAIQSMSPNMSEKFLPSSSKPPLVSNTSIVEKPVEESLDESFIESVTLKLSSDEGEVFSPDKCSNDDNDKWEIKSNSSLDEPKSSSPKNKKVDSIVNHSYKAKAQDNSVMQTPSSKMFGSPSTPNGSLIKTRKSSTRKTKSGFTVDHLQNENTHEQVIVMKDLNTSDQEDEHNTQYFRSLLNKEIDRLTKLCTKWTDIKENATTTEDGQYEINQAIGQTNLLLNKKFERFDGLITACESENTNMLVTCEDLQGFWDMMYIEIKDCDARFEKLEKLRSRNWVDAQTPLRKATRLTRTKPVAKKKNTPARSSSIRKFLAEKRKNKGKQVPENNENDLPLAKETENKVKFVGSNANSNTPKKQNNRRSSVMAVKPEKSRLSLLQQLQFSDTSKGIKSPLAVVKISRMCKTPKVVLENSIPYISTDQTPKKSILKPLKAADVDSSVKSASKVNFNNLIAEEVPSKAELNVTWDENNTLNADTIELNVGKKLTFNDSSMDESKESDPADKTLTEAPSPIRLEHSQRNKKTRTPLRKSLRKQNAIDEGDEYSEQSMVLNVTFTPTKESPENVTPVTPKQRSNRRSMYKKEERDEHDECVKVLRNRTISFVDTPRPTNSPKTSFDVQESEQKENKTPRKTRARRSSVKVNLDDKDRMDLQESLSSMSLSDKRKSLRNVKFSITEKDCNACVSPKPSLPVTPHVRRSGKKSNEKRRNTISEDLIQWETPDKVPVRMRRSQHK